MITTEVNETGQLIRIEWEINDKIDDMGDGHESIWNAQGINIDSPSDERIYYGTAIMIDGQIEEIIDVYSEYSENL